MTGMDAADQPDCPPHLTGEARAEWDRTIAVMAKAGTLATADRAMIAMRALAWARYLDAEERLAKSCAIVKAPRTGVPQYNVWLAVSNEAHRQVKAISFELGLSPNSRAKIGGSTKKADDDTGTGLNY